MDTGKKTNWSVIKEFEENGIIAEVYVSDAARPRYNVRVGRRGERGLIPFLRFFVEGQGKVRVVPIAETVAKVITEAEKYVEGLVQEYEDRYIAERIERESRQVEREGKKRRPSGYKGHGKRAER